MARVSFGDLSCRNKCERKQGLNYDICREIMNMIEALKGLSHEDLHKLKPESSKVILLKDKELILTTYKENLAAGEMLIIVQGFLPTLSFPNYFSTNGIGRMFADGLLVSSNGVKDFAPIRMLFDYW